MISRLFLVSLCALVVACGADASDGTANVVQSGRAELQLVSGDQVAVLPSGSVKVEVRYLPASGESSAGVTVEAAFVDVAPGASLVAPAARTDEQGKVAFTVRVGSSPADFQLRLSAWLADPVYVSVSVRRALDPTVDVSIGYTGLREVETRTVTLIAGMTCERVLGEGLTAEPTYSLHSEEESVVFELGPGLEYAVAAWGKDGTGAKVALGCSQVLAPITASLAEATLTEKIALSDIPFELTDRHDVVAYLSMGPTNERLAEVLLDAVRASLPELSGSDAQLQAAFFVEAIRQKQPDLDAQEASDLVDALATALEAAASSQGPLSLGEELGKLLSGRAQSLTLRLGVIPAGDTLEVSPERLLAQSADASNVGNMPPLAIAPDGLAVSFEGRYDDARALVAVDELQVSLGLGEYAKALWDDVVGDADPRTRFAPTLGCSLVADVLSQKPVRECGAQCGRDACEEALTLLMSELEAAVLALDDVAPSFTLTGTISAHDRDDDGLINDLGPGELTGAWDRIDASGQVGASVQAQVRQASEMTLPL